MITDRIILMTRPSCVAQETVDYFQAKGFRVVTAPVLTIEPVSTACAFDDYDAFITTSMHAIDVLRQSTQDRTRPLFCVGPASQRYAYSCGFETVIAPDVLGGRALIPYIYDWIAQCHNSLFGRQLRMLYAHGDVVKINMAEQIVHPFVRVDACCMYRAVPVTQWSDDVCAMIQSAQVYGVTCYSSRCVRIMHDLIQHHNLRDDFLKMHAFCLTESIADDVRRLGLCSRAQIVNDEA